MVRLRMLIPYGTALSVPRCMALDAFTSSLPLSHRICVYPCVATRSPRVQTEYDGAKSGNHFHLNDCL